MKLLKSQFPVNGQVAAVNENNEPKSFQKGSMKIVSNNEDAVKVKQDADDETKFSLEYVAPGNAKISAIADGDLSDLVKEVHGELELVVQEDMVDQATKLDVTVNANEF